jgi:branched-chain amino acid transport system permease protein
MIITPTMVGQVIISGILSGVLYAMVALGLALIFGVMRIINVAHGPLLMLGAYTTFFLYRAFHLNPYLTVPISMAVLFAVGLLIERTLVFRVIDAPELSSLLLTFGISIALVNAAQLAFTSDLRSVEYLTGSWLVGPFALSKPRVVSFVFATGLTAAAFLFLQRTRLGKAIRATSQSREVAMVCGIDVGAIHRVTFGLACALAAAGGSLIAMIVAIQPEMGQIWTFKSFLVIVLGGAGNYPGALVGGMLLGLVEQLASLFLTTQLSEVVAYVLLVLVLLVRPTGLFGGRQT